MVRIGVILQLVSYSKYYVRQIWPLCNWGELTKKLSFFFFLRAAHTSYANKQTQYAGHVQTFNKSKAVASLITFLDTERDKDKIRCTSCQGLTAMSHKNAWAKRSCITKSVQLPRKWPVFRACILLEFIKPIWGG